MQVYKVERPDDLPLLSKVIESSNLSSHLDTHFIPHGNWNGISFGKVISGWLLYILSCSDHRLHYVEDWVDGREETLRHILSERNSYRRNETLSHKHPGHGSFFATEQTKM